MEEQLSKPKLLLHKIGILAYGSLIDDLGDELEKVLVTKIHNVRTPFLVEFARSSSTRDGAPTLVLCNKGSQVNGVILVLDENQVGIQLAKTLLYRRETRSKKNYAEKKKGRNLLKIVEYDNFHGVEKVIYTRLKQNILKPTAGLLADLAIKSAMKNSGKNKKDGISYLIQVKKGGIKTPLISQYESQILEKTKTNSLEEAHEKLIKVGTPLTTETASKMTVERARIIGKKRLPNHIKNLKLLFKEADKKDFLTRKLKEEYSNILAIKESNSVIVKSRCEAWISYVRKKMKAKSTFITIISTPMRG